MRAVKSLHRIQALLAKHRRPSRNCAHPESDSEPVTYGLALSLYSQGQSALFNGRGTAAQLNQAADLLRPARAGARQFAPDPAGVRGHAQYPQPHATEGNGRRFLPGSTQDPGRTRALDLSNLNAASGVCGRQADSKRATCWIWGDADEAQKVESQVYELTEKVLVQRPGDLRSLANRFFATDLLGTLAERRHDDTAAADYGRARGEPVKTTCASIRRTSRPGAGGHRVCRTLRTCSSNAAKSAQALATYRSLMALAPGPAQAFQPRTDTICALVEYRGNAGIAGRQGCRRARGRCRLFAKDSGRSGGNLRSPKIRGGRLSPHLPDGLRGRVLLLAKAKRRPPSPTPSARDQSHRAGQGGRREPQFL